MNGLNKMKTHETTIKKYNGTMKELARDIADLRYDALAELINELNKNILEYSVKDEQRGYIALSTKLRLISNDLNFIYNQFLGAWAICKKYMTKKPELVKSKYDYWKENEKDILVTWEYFNDNYNWCDKCKSYQEGSCLCYTR